MDYFKRVCKVFLGSWLTAISILCFIQSGQGMDPISTCIAGLQNHVNLQFGTLVQLFNMSILLVMFFLDRKILGIGSIINAFFVGFFVKIFAFLFTFELLNAVNEYVYMILAPLCMGVGVAIYLSANLGVASVESLMVYVSNHTKLSLKTARVSLDFTLVASGIVLGAPYGLGTIIAIFLIGPILSFVLKKIEEREAAI